MTKREALVRLVTAQMPNALEKSGDSTKVMVENAMHVLAEIERVSGGSVNWAQVEAYKKEIMATEEVLEEVIQRERDRCYKIACEVRWTLGNTPADVRDNIAAAIRGGGA